MTDVDTDNDENNLEPIGDLADLIASVCEGMPTDEDFPGGTGDHVPYKGKGKGVGKGKSGSSGPPVKEVGKANKLSLFKIHHLLHKRNLLSQELLKPSR